MIPQISGRSRSLPPQWADAAQTLADLLERFQEWLDNLPSGLANSATFKARESYDQTKS
jgi:hypothetical protein